MTIEGLSSAVAVPRARIQLSAAVVLGGVILAFVVGCGKPPQIGADAEVHKVVDALFTAITAHDAAKLQQCEKSLSELKDGGKLPNSAHAALSPIISEAHAGQWDSAAKRLYDFIDGQQIGPDR